tara:strand:+ start:761 stop:1348 length:588 start_codon:yes stop_codon:yes gene_type:complete
MSDTSTTSIKPLPDGMEGLTHDWASDQRAFKGVPWGKAMMWIFLLSDTFIFSCFLISYMTARWSTVVPWPNPSEVFALTVGGVSVPLLLIAIMTFILITSSGTMAMAVRSGYQKKRKQTAILLLITAILGASFVGMQAFEWTKLIIRRCTPLGKSLWCATIWFSIFYGNWFSRFSCFYRCNLFIYKCQEGVERGL